jgi:hypothetical protein
MLQLYPDFRIGGKPKFILADEPPKLMFIPDAVRKCVVYIGYATDSGDISLQGTAFFVARQIEGTDYSSRYLVTAAHIIQGISKKDNFNGKILLRINIKEGNAFTVETDYSNWFFHPEETEVDVAVLPHIMLPDLTDIQSVSFHTFLTEVLRIENQISVGDEVFLTGLFYNHYGKERNIPIVRLGNISAMPEEKILTKFGFMDAYLVEARSIGGMSGSPVFVHQSIFETMKKGEMLVGTGNERGSTFYLLGLMHGHFDVDLLTEDSADMDAKNKANQAINMGIAIVVPADKILEVLNQPMIRDTELLQEKELREKMMPTMDSLEEGVIITQKGFEEALKRVSRKTYEPVSEKKETSE